jgi:hypothetical protein
MRTTESQKKPKCFFYLITFGIRRPAAQVRGGAAASLHLAAMAEEEEDVTMHFAAKKKKKPAKAAAEGEVAAAPAAAAPSAAEGGSGSGASAAAAPAATLTTSAPLLSEDGEREESYEDMLSRVYTLLNEHNPELIGRCVYQLCSLPLPLAACVPTFFALPAPNLLPHPHPTRPTPTPPRQREAAPQAPRRVPRGHHAHGLDQL